ncbi:hypothetical protein RF679_03370 [Undibacterium cyanobacteriorum]|uniref:Uncharacterized protein n=1 Tax=Undibacterium cyanobacteriorum TaxID=3073561 RepID=A0ABY9RK56_9BURK|nr:hypothetical protein [Undibacterium sp. 20NA77.5]WMW81331.1 hypothetical protein RF679_03370 [Undibacterium sp. 20NA77.5]
MMSRKFELAFGLIVIAFEYRPERWDSHQQNVLGVDLDQDASTRLWSNVECITQWLMGSF